MTSSLLAQADRAAAAKDYAAALGYLDMSVEQGGGSLDLHLRRAAMARGIGQRQLALSALEAALTFSPLDFVALLMRAALLDEECSPEAGEAYARAIAQEPSGSLPDHLAKMLDRAKARHADYVKKASKLLNDTVAHTASKAEPAERLRMERFRTNILRQTRPYHSEPTHYHYPGLREIEFHDRTSFPWLARLEQATGQIEAEFTRVSAAERSELVPYIRYPQHVPIAQWKMLNHSRAWTAIHLIQNGRVIDANARHCPQLMSLLSEIPQPHVKGRSPNAMFSLLAPGTHIPPHHGVSNTRLVCHLPLIVPDGCWFRVGATMRDWKRGEAFVFDDTIEHEAMNGGDALRVVLIIDIWHPDLSPVECEAVGEMMVASGIVTGGAI